jgi:hypothetical protein
MSRFRLLDTLKSLEIRRFCGFLRNSDRLTYFLQAALRTIKGGIWVVLPLLEFDSPIIPLLLGYQWNSGLDTAEPNNRLKNPLFLVVFSVSIIRLFSMLFYIGRILDPLNGQKSKKSLFIGFLELLFEIAKNYLLPRNQCNQMSYVLHYINFFLFLCAGSFICSPASFKTLFAHLLSLH